MSQTPCPTPRVAFSTLSCPDWSWTDILERGPQYGYDGVEVRLIARETDLLSIPEFQPGALATRRRELDAAGFEICGLASSISFDKTEAAERTRQLGTGKDYVDMAVEVGAKFVRVFGDVLPSENGPGERDSAIARVAEGLDQLSEYAGSAGISILLETHGDFLESSVICELMSQVGNPAAGILWDTHHPWYFCGEPVRATFEALRPWIRHTHWKDSIPSKPGEIDEAMQAAATQANALMGGHRHADYVLFGEGRFPAQECMRLLRSSGYDGWFCYEWEKMWHPEIEDPEAALPPFPGRLRQLWQSAEPS
jgi:sugar phosphate isomerase/epimerase